MDKRIKQLAEQCYHRYSEHNIDLEKFAKLIVLECAEVSFKHWEQHKGCSAHFSIREHFGVEE